MINPITKLSECGCFQGGRTWLASYIKNCSLLAYLHFIFCYTFIETLLTCEDSDLAGNLSSLRIIWLCGEVVTTALRDRCMRTLPWIKLLNLYSVSECHDVATADLTNMPFQSEVCVYAVKTIVFD